VFHPSTSGDGKGCEGFSVAQGSSGRDWLRSSVSWRGKSATTAVELGSGLPTAWATVLCRGSEAAWDERGG
jgi:hypothetical protein